jgi:hypothetical protein
MISSANFCARILYNGAVQFFGGPSAAWVREAANSASDAVIEATKARFEKVFILFAFALRDEVELGVCVLVGGEPARGQKTLWQARPLRFGYIQFLCAQTLRRLVDCSHELNAT